MSNYLVKYLDEIVVKLNAVDSLGARPGHFTATIFLKVLLEGIGYFDKEAGIFYNTGNTGAARTLWDITDGALGTPPRGTSCRVG